MHSLIALILSLADDCVASLAFVLPGKLSFLAHMRVLVLDFNACPKSKLSLHVHTCTKLEREREPNAHIETY